MQHWKIGVYFMCFVLCSIQGFAQYRSNEQALFSPSGDTVLILWNQYLSTPNEGSQWTSNFHVYGNAASGELQLLHEFKFSQKNGDFLLDSIPTDSLQLFNLTTHGQPIFNWSEQGFNLHINEMDTLVSSTQKDGYCFYNFAFEYCADTLSAHRALRTKHCDENVEWCSAKVWQHGDRQHFFVLFTYQDNQSTLAKRKMNGHVVKRFVTMQP